MGLDNFEGKQYHKICASEIRTTGNVASGRDLREVVLDLQR